jgi:hypothetical protein
MRKCAKSSVGFNNSDAMTPKDQLIPLLQRAASRFLALGHSDIFGSDDYTDKLGIFCQEAASKMMAGELSDEEATRLYFVFAPTCAWDDSVGDVDLGNSIFRLVDILYRNIALKK